MDFLHSLATIRTPFLNVLMTAISYLGHEIIPVVVICIFYWCVSKKLAHKMAFSFFFSGLLCQGLKLVCRIDRPWNLDGSFHEVASARGSATGYSFPSGHTQAATSLYSTIALFFKKRWVKLICILLIVLIGFSRMYLGVHTFLDVGVAFALTAAVSVAVFFLYDRIYGKKGALEIITALMILVSAGLLIYDVVLITNGTMDPAKFPPIDGREMTVAEVYRQYFADSIKTSGAGMAFAIGYFIERKFIDFSVETSGIKPQIIKTVCGVVPAIGAYLGLKVLFNAIFTDIPLMIFGDFIRYFLLVFWIIAVYPAIFKKVLAKRAEVEA